MSQMEGKRKRFIIISGIILLVNLLVLSGVIGEHGVGYLAGALECILLLLLLTAYTMPEAMAKLMRARLQKGQSRNARRVWSAALCLSIVYSLFGSVLLGFGADFFMEKLLGVSYSAFTLRLLIPAYILFVFAQTFRGFFQGMGSTVPTGVSKILEKIILFGAGILFCFLFQNYGEKVAAFLVNEEFYSSFASAGVAVGLTVAELFVLLFLFFVYLTNKKSIRTGNRETLRMSERLSELLYILVITMLPAITATLLGRCTVLGGMALYQHTAGVEPFVGIGVCGAFYGKYLAVILLLVMIFRLSVISLEGQLQSAYRKEEYKYVRERLSYGVHFLVIQGAFWAVLLATLGDTLMRAFYGGDSGLAGQMLKCGSTLVLFLALGIHFIYVLIGQGRMNVVLLNLAGGAVVFFLSGVLCTVVFHAGIIGIVIGLCISWFVIMCGCGFVCMRSMKWRPEWIYLFAIPVGCAALTGLIEMLLNKAIVSLVGEVLSCLICILAGAVIYFILLLALRGIRREEFDTFPGGRILCKFAELLHFL